MLLEKGSTPGAFEVVEKTTVKYTDSDNHVAFNYVEELSADKDSYYRLRIVDTDGKNHFSNVLVFRNQNQLKQFKVYPTVIESSTTFSFQATSPGNGIFQLIDPSGRIITQYKIHIESGNNHIMINNLGSMRSGYYTAFLKLEDTIQSSKVYKR